MARFSSMSLGLLKASQRAEDLRGIKERGHVLLLRITATLINTLANFKFVIYIS